MPNDAPEPKSGWESAATTSHRLRRAFHADQRLHPLLRFTALRHEGDDEHPVIEMGAVRPATAIHLAHALNSRPAPEGPATSQQPPQLPPPDEADPEQAAEAVGAALARHGIAVADLAVVREEATSTARIAFGRLPIDTAARLADVLETLPLRHPIPGGTAGSSARGKQ
jgi:hypothetical protein